VDILFCNDATNSSGVNVADITQPKPIRLDLGQYSTDICNPAASAMELPKQCAEPTFRGAFRDAIFHLEITEHAMFYE